MFVYCNSPQITFHYSLTLKNWRATWYLRKCVAFALRHVPHCFHRRVNGPLLEVLSVHSALNGNTNIPCLCLWDLHSPSYGKGRKKWLKRRGKVPGPSFFVQTHSLSHFNPLLADVWNFFTGVETDGSYPPGCGPLPAFGCTSPPSSPSPSLPSRQTPRWLTTQFILLQGLRFSFFCPVRCKELTWETCCGGCSSALAPSYWCLD